jgi:hypothetical protein
VSDRLQPLSETAMETLRQVVALYNATAPCFADKVFPLGRQDAAPNGPTGLAGLESQTGRRALIFFGDASQARECAPSEFASLFDKAPQMGDEGSNQFSPAYLWADP